MMDWTNVTVKLGDLQPWEHNPRTMTKRQAQRLLKSWRELGQFQTIAIGPHGEVYDGHQRLNALLTVHDASFEVEARQSERELNDDERAALTLAANLPAGAWDWSKLAQWDAGAIAEWGMDAETLATWNNDAANLATMLGVEEDSAQAEDGIEHMSLVDRFGVPPFSVLDARQGYWQARKRAWLALGIQSEIGRDSFSSADARTFKGATQNVPSNMTAYDTPSIFDPVLCELICRWFSPAQGASILDPFAGGSVRGIVASRLGYEYTGVDLRLEQIEANKVQAQAITPDKMPHWIIGDSINIKELANGEYDLIFSCPPYFDLELYSDDERDISNARNYDSFLSAYRAIIASCAAMLRDDRFSCFVVGDIRDKRGFYRNFPADTIAAFQDAGMMLYNEAILITPLGTVMMQTSRNFPIYRKLGKTHQNVLIFYKGNPNAIRDWVMPEFGDVEEL